MCQGTRPIHRAHTTTSFSLPLYMIHHVLIVGTIHLPKFIPIEMTVMCLNCSKNKSSVVGFVVKGVFCDRTTVWGKAPHENQKYPWYVTKNLGKKICLCKDCGISLSRKGDSNIVGFLNQRQYTSYKNDANLCDVLHNRGYLVLKEQHWKDTWDLGSFGLNELTECFQQKKKATIQNLNSHECTLEGSPKKHKGTRRWAFWEGDTKFVEKAIANCKGGNHPSLGGVRSNASTRSLVQNSIVHADIHHARIARDNVRHESSQTTLKHEKTLELLDFACLWRRTYIDMGQCPHADTDAGHYHLVMPMSSEPYEIEVWPYTHLTTSRCHIEENIVTSSNKVTLHLRVGQILIFCSNLIHCGGRSRYPSKNLERIKKNININWFTGANKNEPIADLSIHASLQNTLTKQNIKSNYTTGAAEFIRVYILDDMVQKGIEAVQRYETMTLKKNKAIQYLKEMKKKRFNTDVHMGEGSATNSSCDCLRDTRKRRRDNSTTEEKEGKQEESKRKRDKVKLINNCRLLFHFLDDATRAIMDLKED